MTNAHGSTGDPSKPKRWGWRAIGVASLVWMIIVIGAIAAVIALWRHTFPVYSWHQKTTVVIGTPQGTVSGSSTVSVTWGDGLKILPDPPHVYHYFRGEAVVVELPSRRYLFALVKNAEFEPLKVFGAEKLPNYTPWATDTLLPAAREVTEHYGQTRTLTPEQYPMLVTFNDINDPASVTRVDPANLEKSFGKGYSINAITMTITDEPVTEGKVEKVLGWLEEAGRARPTLIPNPPRLRKDATDPEMQYLTVGSFSTELYK